MAMRPRTTMAEVIEFDPVDSIVAGALGEPGRRTFLIQAVKGEMRISLLLEKEQVAALSNHLLGLLEDVDPEHPEQPDDIVAAAGGAPELEEAEEPLFRVRLIRVGFDRERDRVFLELFENAPEDLEELTAPGEELVTEGRLARLYCDRIQARAMAVRGAQAVAAGRPTCRLCWLPKDPEGHQCPAMN